MDWSADELAGKSSWTSMIGSTVTEGFLHAEHVTVEVNDPANVWSTITPISLHVAIPRICLADRRRGTYGQYSCSSTFGPLRERESGPAPLGRTSVHLSGVSASCAGTRN